MDITVYLPDVLGKRAKGEGVNLSRMLRAALEEHFWEADAMATALENAREYKFELHDRDGDPYTGRLTGKRIAAEDRYEVYLTTDERVLVHDTDDATVWEAGTDEGPDLEESLRAILDHDAFKDAMRALGIKPVVDL